MVFLKLNRTVQPVNIEPNLSQFSYLGSLTLALIHAHSSDLKQLNHGPEVVLLNSNRSSTWVQNWVSRSLVEPVGH